MRFPACAAAVLLLLSCAKEAPEPPAPTPSPAATTSTTEAVTVTCTAAAGRLCPVDEGPRDATFLAFREALKDAVNRKDEARLLELVDPAIRTNFGGGGGHDDFRNQWKTSSPDSERWRELTQIITLGGTFKETSFWAPYVYSAWPDAVDPFEHVAAIRAGVPIRSEASQQASVVTEVDWEILRVLPGTNAAWKHVKTSGGQEGWALASDVRSPIGYRAGFSKRSGAWKMEALVAGD